MYAVTYKTESGDEGFVGLYDEKPTDGHLSAIAVERYPGDVVDEGDGPRLFIFFKVYGPLAVTTLPEPIKPIPSI